MDNYLFTNIDKVWYLKITDIEKLDDYYNKTDAKWGQILLKAVDILNGENNVSYDDKIAKYAIMIAEKNRINIITAVEKVKLDILQKQLDLLLDGYTLLINRSGGYSIKKEYEDTNFAFRKELVFPNFTEDDIRVKKFPQGAHYYAYIDDVEVHDGDIIKWDTYQMAYNKAKELIA